MKPLQEVLDHDPRFPTALREHLSGRRLLASGGLPFAGAPQVVGKRPSGGPLAAERVDDNRVDQDLDVGPPGVLRPELRPLVRVHPAFEEGPQDRGIDGAPIEPRGDLDAGDLAGGQFEDGGVGEEVAVEVSDRVEPEVSPLGHRGEQLADEPGEPLGVSFRLLDEPPEQLVGKQLHVLGEQAEDDAVEEPGGLGGVDPALPHALGDRADPAGGVGRDGHAGHAGLQLVRVVEDGADDLDVPGVAEFVERDLVDLLHGAGEVRMDDQPVHVADDQQRRVLQRLAIFQELVVRGRQVFMLPLVFPAKEPALPDVGPAVAAAVLLGAALERVPLAQRVGLGGLRMSEDLAQVEEVLLRGRPLGEFALPPFRDEPRDVHDGKVSGEREEGLGSTQETARVC